MQGISLVYLVQLVAEAGAYLSDIGSDSEYSEPMIYHPQALTLMWIQLTPATEISQSIVQNINCNSQQELFKRSVVTTVRPHGFTEEKGGRSHACIQGNRDDAHTT